MIVGRTASRGFDIINGNTSYPYSLGCLVTNCVFDAGTNAGAISGTYCVSKIRGCQFLNMPNAVRVAYGGGPDGDIIIDSNVITNVYNSDIEGLHENTIQIQTYTDEPCQVFVNNNLIVASV